MNTLQDVTNKAKYVEWYDNYTFAVWLGGHTVNFYAYSDESSKVTATTCINVGSFKENEATLQEVKDGIENEWELIDNNRE